MIEATGDLVTNHVNVVRLGESVVDQNSEKLETLILFHTHTIPSILKSSPLLTLSLAECTSMHLVFKVFSFRPLLSSHKFAKYLLPYEHSPVGLHPLEQPMKLADSCHIKVYSISNYHIIPITIIF